MADSSRALPSDRAVVNGAASASALRASVPSAFTPAQFAALIECVDALSLLAGEGFCAAEDAIFNLHDAFGGDGTLEYGEWARQGLHALAEQQHLTALIRAKLQEPIFLRMRGDLLANYRTPTQIAACCVWAGEPSPGSTIPAIAQGTLTRSAETEGLSPKDGGPVPQGCAQPESSHD